jgi:hypothetical protein
MAALATVGGSTACKAVFERWQLSSYRANLSTPVFLS